MLPSKDRARLRGKETSSGVDGEEDTTSVVRCSCCKRPLKRPESVRAGMGWRCLKAAA